MIILISLTRLAESLRHQVPLLLVNTKNSLLGTLLHHQSEYCYLSCLAQPMHAIKLAVK